MNFKLFWCTSLLALLCINAQAQVTGGQFSFEYLRLSNSPHVSALGGINVAHPGADVSLAMQNPALMRPELHNNLSLNYNNFYADISNANLAYGYFLPKLNTAFALGVQYMNYGNFAATDEVGNTIGNFKANDYTLSLAASRQYREHWRYGATLKFAQSSLADWKASALLADIGVCYEDTANLLTIGAVAKNMGGMINKYTPGSAAEPLPFDLQLGISKRFKHLPLRLFGTVHHLYEWDIRYDNAADNNTNKVFGTSDTTQSNHFADKLFRHFIFGGELTIAKRLTVTVAYNHLRRRELSVDSKRGATGYSFGGNINLNKFQVYYARSYYSIAGPYNEFGLNIQLNKLFGGGPVWKATYPKWEE
ncbi:type IX secretion system protein PorQ [Rurimicrobium arvi]